MQTEELVAGPTLDAEVATKVMGWTSTTLNDGQRLLTKWSDDTGQQRGFTVPAYSTDISDAWQVLDAMVWRVGTANIRLDMEDYGRGFLNDEGAERAVWVTIGDWTVCGPAPLAICKAALAALDT